MRCRAGPAGRLQAGGQVNRDAACQKPPAAASCKHAPPPPALAERHAAPLAAGPPLRLRHGIMQAPEAARPRRVDPCKLDPAGARGEAQSSRSLITTAEPLDPAVHSCRDPRAGACRMFQGPSPAAGAPFPLLSPHGPACKAASRYGSHRADGAAACPASEGLDRAASRPFRPLFVRQGQRGRDRVRAIRLRRYRPL